MYMSILVGIENLDINAKMRLTSVLALTRFHQHREFVDLIMPQEDNGLKEKVLGTLGRYMEP